MPDKTDGACAICGRALEWWVDPKTRKGHWEHATADRLAGVDHDPIWVSEKDITPNYRCDFCSQDDPQFEVEVRDINNVAGLPNANSLGHWMLCGECKPFIDHGAWRALVDRVVRVNPSISADIASGDLTESDARFFLTGMYAQVRANMTGKPIRALHLDR